MNIVKKETLMLSQNESRAMDEVTRILEGILHGATDPHLRNAASMALSSLYEIWDYLPDEEESEE